MKVAVTSEGTTTNSHVEWRFGRGHYFLVFDTDSDLWEPPVTVLNEAAEANECAGTQAARTVILTGAQAVIAGHIGTKAFKALEEEGVRAYSSGGKTAAEALEAFTANELQAFTGPDLCSLLGRPSNSTVIRMKDMGHLRPPVPILPRLRECVKTKACWCGCNLCIAAGLVFLGILVLTFSFGVSLIGALLAALATHSSLVMGITSLTITVVLAALIFLRMAYR